MSELKVSTTPGLIVENSTDFNTTTEGFDEMGLDIGPIVEYVPVSTNIISNQIIVKHTIT